MRLTERLLFFGRDELLLVRERPTRNGDCPLTPLTLTTIRFFRRDRPIPIQRTVAIKRADGDCAMDWAGSDYFALAPCFGSSAAQRDSRHYRRAFPRTSPSLPFASPSPHSPFRRILVFCHWSFILVDPAPSPHLLWLKAISHSCCMRTSRL